jgi:circadian clock protein KaiB
MATKISSKPTDEKENEIWIFRLYVADQMPKCVAAANNLKLICEEHLKGKYRIELIGLFNSPQAATEHQIIVVPTLVRTLPLPARKIIGDLADKAQVLAQLDLPNER